MTRSSTRFPSPRIAMSGRSRVALSAAVVLAGVLIGEPEAFAAKSTTVAVAVTSTGCAPKPATAPAGEIDITISNKSRGAVSAAELRTSDLSHVLGEQEDLSSTAAGGFSVDLQPGTYVVSCPGAAKPHWAFTVTGTVGTKATALTKAASGYRSYVDANAASLVTSSTALCKAIGTGSLTAAQAAYPKARVFYERIEPVAGIWGALDTKIDGRWENPVTIKSQFVGFHRIEQLLFQTKAVTGTAALCSGLVQNEKRLHSLVSSAAYSPLEMAAGATDLVNEAATSKITGEEERYSHTDLTVIEANLQGANEVVSLLKSYLSAHERGLLATLQERYTAATKSLDTFAGTYDSTRYVNYATVSDTRRRSLSQALNAYAETLSKLSAVVG